MFIARDLESKRSLYALHCPAYIVAHKEVLTDITDLIGENIRFLESKAQEMLDCLQDGMTFDEWIYAFCKRENVRTHNLLKFSVAERNFSNFADWMEDEGHRGGPAGILRQKILSQAGEIKPSTTEVPSQ